MKKVGLRQNTRSCSEAEGITEPYSAQWHVVAQSQEAQAGAYTQLQVLGADFSPMSIESSISREW